MGPAEMVIVPADASTLTAVDAIVLGRHGPVLPQAGPTPGRFSDGCVYMSHRNMSEHV